MLSVYIFGHLVAAYSGRRSLRQGPSGVAVAKKFGAQKLEQSVPQKTMAF